MRVTSKLQILNIFYNNTIHNVVGDLTPRPGYQTDPRGRGEVQTGGEVDRNFGEGGSPRGEGRDVLPQGLAGGEVAVAVDEPALRHVYHFPRLCGIKVAAKTLREKLGEHG